ncbi:MAG: TRAP transporter fused permease subunit [Alphaproteobacteria bacterium]|nr:TRAP transporter fused permease subunit [Alphaproteobacteria bacterium]
MSYFEIVFGTGAAREPRGIVGAAIRPFAAAISAGVVYSTLLASLSFNLFGITIRLPGVDLFSLMLAFLGAILALCFLTIAPNAQADPERISPFDYLLAAASIATGVYFTLHGHQIITRISLLDELSLWDKVFGSTLLLLTLEVSRRTTGLGLTVLVLLFFAYDLWGHLLSGPLGHGHISFEHFLDLMVFTTDGIFGAPLRVSATYAFLFVMFGTILNLAGGGEFFFRFAAALTGRAVGGPAKIAVISSGLYGTISGNPIADVVTTGSVTIPIMRRLGYPAALAGGIEVAASTGGSIAPPVLGSAAFIMAEYTGIPYGEIAIAATIPALLYYLGVYAQVDLRARKDGLRGLDGEIPRLLPTLRDGWIFIVPLVTLTLAIVIGFSANMTAMIGTVSVFIVALFDRRYRIGLVGLYRLLVETAMRMVPVAGACAAAGLIVGGLTMTGLASKFIDLIALVTGNDLLLSLLVTAVLTTLLGLGLPTSSSYILAAVLVAPVLIKLGLSLMAAHMFIFYYAVLSNVTPPVAVAAYAAAAIAQSNPLTISVLACRLTLVAFIVPFSFAYGEELLMRGDPLLILGSTVLASIGVVLLAVAIEGWLDRRVNTLSRVLFFVAGCAFIVPELWFAATGAAFAAAGWFARYLPERRRA